MVINNSLDEFQLIATLLRDVQRCHGEVFSTTDLKNTLNKCASRYRAEGMSFLTKTLPKLGKAFDKAIAGATRLNAAALGFESQEGSELPKLFGEFFNRVLQPTGELLQFPCAFSVQVIRQLCYLFYKYKLPFTDEQERAVVASFEKTEHDLTTSDNSLREIEDLVVRSYNSPPGAVGTAPWKVNVARNARAVLNRLFDAFDPTDVTPRHGPGIVATKQRLWGKFHWSNVASQITNVYPFDAYFCASLGHVCDRWRTFESITDKSLPAKVLLVPKDSRGPRLISCEPVDYQWAQQGLGSAIVKHVESHPLTRESVRFTDQEPNRNAALVGSATGRYATLDLNEASDRVSLDLVRLLFPYKVLPYLEACRTTSTCLPDGRVLPLRKFAPMGSCLCFPVLSLVVWSLLSSNMPDTYTRDRVYVYGDDVIVPTTQVENAIIILESFGLKVNRDKSCTSGLFRESCGMDAFLGQNVTPVRLRTVWSSRRSPNVYTSWIAYANSFYDKRYFATYDLIVGALSRIYGPMPSVEQVGKTCPALREIPPGQQVRRRWNKNLHKFEYHCYGVRAPVITKSMDGWLMLLRYFTEASAGPTMAAGHNLGNSSPTFEEESVFRDRKSVV